MTTSNLIDADKVIFFFSSLSPLTASLFITIIAFRLCDPTGLVYSIHDPTEVAIQKMFDASQRMIGAFLKLSELNVSQQRQE